MSVNRPARTPPSVREAYKQFLNTEEGARVYEQFKQILYTSDDSLVRILDNVLLQCLPLSSRDKLSVCDIGGGDGKRIKKILKFLHEELEVQFRLDFVEQSPYLMRAFDASEIATFTQTRKFGALFEEAALPGDYDLVFLIHSIFAFQNPSVFDRVLSLPNSQGRIIVVSNEQDSFLAGLKRILDVNYEDSRFEVGHLIDLLMERGSPFRRIAFETKWALAKEVLSQKVDVILNWLSLGRFKDISDQRKREVWRYIAENSLDVGEHVEFSEREIILLISPAA